MNQKKKNSYTEELLETYKIEWNLDNLLKMSESKIRNYLKLTFTEGKIKDVLDNIKIHRIFKEYDLNCLINKSENEVEELLKGEEEKIIKKVLEYIEYIKKNEKVENKTGELSPKENK